MIKGCTCYLLGASLDGAVLAGHVLAVPVVGGAAGQAEVRVALPHCQVAGALLGVTLSFAAAAREAVLTCKHGKSKPVKTHSKKIGYFVFQNKSSYTPSCTGRTSHRSFAR